LIRAEQASQGYKIHATTTLTLNVVNFNNNGEKIADPIFHLLYHEKRQISFPGVEEYINWEKNGVTHDSNEDGLNCLKLSHHTIEGQVVWDAQNANGSQYLASTLYFGYLSALGVFAVWLTSQKKI